ncbi:MULTISPECIES: hypothetical protein [unclassified Caballeronia]|uniref:hypothetical protein n=1 Tax=unclassified Caballeronia TaxID=2646786 RepID=UPI002028B9D3|nr:MULTISPECIES: hypothetical protein [unclassified Caballeronia]
MNLQTDQDADNAMAPAALLGSGIVLVWNDIDEAGREQFYEWHDKEHIPERLAIAGFRRGRRFRKAGHSPEWLTMYEAADLDVMSSPGYMARLNAPTPATTKTLTYFRNTSRAVCRPVFSVGESSGGHVLAIRIDGAASSDVTPEAWLRDVAFPQAMSSTGVLACHLFASDQASFLDTEESRTRAFDVPAWIVLVEASTEEAAERAREFIDAPQLHDAGLRPRRDAAVYALEICRLGVLSRST